MCYLRFEMEKKQSQIDESTAQHSESGTRRIFSEVIMARQRYALEAGAFIVGQSAQQVPPSVQSTPSERRVRRRQSRTGNGYGLR